MYKVFIDGEAGTTGLRIADRLDKRGDLAVLKIDPDLRKDEKERRKLINEADIAFLCLPDDAAREAVAFIDNPRTRVIDASTAHRTASGWAYGFPELSASHRKAVQYTPRVAVPGCHATGFIALCYPLVKAGLLPPDYPFSCMSLTGYSGGGKKMIAEYENGERESFYSFPREYGIAQKHKHLPEMKAVCGLDYPPIFTPVVSDYYAGMEVNVHVHMRMLSKKMTVKDLWEFYKAYYEGSRVTSVAELNGEGVLKNGYTDAGALAGSDRLELFVCGNDDSAVLISRFDNLGKGASGAAVQCMNLMLGFDETTGLTL
jgi:N-acetyl-gamma-glutamyl-phosphate reductase